MYESKTRPTQGAFHFSVLAGRTIAGPVSEQIKSAFSKGFLPKNHLLRAYYLWFDWSGWIVLISEVKVSIRLECSGRSVLTNGKHPATLFPVFASVFFFSLSHSYTSWDALKYLNAWNWLPQLWSEHHVVSVGQGGIQTPWKNLKLWCRRSGGGHIGSFNYVTSLYVLHTGRVAYFRC